MSDKEQNNQDNSKLDLLSTILTDSELRPEELKKIDEEKSKNLINQDNKENIIFDINIKTIDDLIDILLKNEYDFLVIEPEENYIKIIFKKDSINKDIKYIKHQIYFNILLQSKKISKLDIENTSIEQKGAGEYMFQNRNFEVLSKTVPSNFGEKLFIKVKEVNLNKEIKKQAKKPISPTKVFSFLGAFLIVSLIILGSFLTFVVLNAKTPEDVAFFSNLGINLNDVNSFLLKLTTIVFSIVLLILTILLAISLFKAILTKKDLKKKKIFYSIISGFLLIITFGTGGLWITLDKVIKQLPNWQEMSYGNIQIYDNNLLNSEVFDKSNSLITNYTNLIGPIDLKFDLNYLKKEELRQGFEIKKYIWDFGDGTKIESLNPEIIKSFNKKGTYKINLILEGIDRRFPDKISRKPVPDIPELSIGYIVDIKENKLSNGGKTISFDARDLKPLGQIEWYLPSDLEKPAYVGELFQPTKIYFEEEVIGMRIKNKNSKGLYMDRVFVISGETSQISGEIDFEVDNENDLKYTFFVKNIENSFGDGFIESFNWIIEDRENIKKSDILNIKESSKITHLFGNYGKQVIKVILTNSSGKKAEIIKEIYIPKKLKLKELIEIYDITGEYPEIISDLKYNDKLGEYSIYNLSSPIKLEFDAKKVRSENALYTISEIKWDLDNDGNYEKTGKNIEQSFDLNGFYEIPIVFVLTHRRDPKDIVEINQKIILKLQDKEVDLVLNIKPDSEYVPAIVSFDASKSKVKDDNIIKFIYDYGDGVIEERDAINSGHRYLKEGNYKVKLTVVTQKGKQYSISKNLVLKNPPLKANINVSLKRAPVNQEIDFSSSNSVGQIVGYFWDFGDGNTSNEANPTHAYKKPGKYKVKLTLDFVNNNVLTDETEIEIYD